MKILLDEHIDVRFKNGLLESNNVYVVRGRGGMVSETTGLL